MEHTWSIWVQINDDQCITSVNDRYLPTLQLGHDHGSVHIGSASSSHLDPAAFVWGLRVVLPYGFRKGDVNWRLKIGYMMVHVQLKIGKTWIWEHMEKNRRNLHLFQDSGYTGWNTRVKGPETSVCGGLHGFCRSAIISKGPAQFQLILKPLVI